MGIRGRIVLLCGAAVAIAVITAAVGSYVAVRGELLGQIDESLDAQARIVDDLAAQGLLGERPPGNRFAERLPDPPVAAPPREDPGVRIQRITPTGEIARRPRSAGRLPVSDAQVDLASEGSGRLTSEVSVEGERFRLLTVGVGEDGAIVLGRSLEGADGVLERLRLTLALIAFAGIAFAGVLAFLVGRRVLAPIRGLTETAEHITETSDLQRRLEIGGSDEVARLASRFNAMLETIGEHQQALELSVNSQRQLVADASHELRTPVAAIRTDVETLLAHPDLPAEERVKILASADGRIEELTDVILDVIELARGDGDDREDDSIDQVRLDLIAADSIARMQSIAPDRVIASTLEETVVVGRADRLFRAINNLLDNANKYSPAEQPIEVTVSEGAIEVRDHGPGIDSDSLPRLFDRFWRGPATHHRPGSGLGLAIVKQVTVAGGGEVTVENMPSGGASFRLSFPVSSERPAEAPRV